MAERTKELTAANANLKNEAEERERIEETLRQSLKMEAVGQLTGGLAHDFNNLLAGISGSLELIRTRITQGRVGGIERYLGVAMTSVNRAAALTHRLLAFSRRQTLAPKPTDINLLIGGVKELFSRTVGPSIQIDAQLNDDLWPALCDPNQLENAMLNLVINARDAMPDGGRLSIKTRNSAFPDWRTGANTGPVGKVPQGEYMGLFVTDSGSGMPPDVVARAFKMHVGGSVSSNVVTLPRSYLIGNARPSVRGARLYIVLNTKLLPSFKVVDDKTTSIVSRTIETTNKDETRTDLSLVYEAAHRDGLDFNLTYIERQEPETDPFGFDTAYMRRLYDRGEQIGVTGSFWKKAPPPLGAQNEIIVSR